MVNKYDTFLNKKDINLIREKRGQRPIRKRYAVVNDKDRVLKTFDHIKDVRKFLKK